MECRSLQKAYRSLIDGTSAIACGRLWKIDTRDEDMTDVQIAVAVALIVIGGLATIFVAVSALRNRP